MKILYFLIAFITFYEVNADSKRFCGPLLVQVLESVCVDGYNSLITKKSVPFHKMLNGLDMNNYIGSDTDGLNDKNSLLEDLLTQDHTNSFAVTRRRRNLLGIYDECCVKGCSYNEIRSYCKQDS
ncbi:insulin-like peptide 5 [Cochliomyia hominivorax]